MSSRPGRSSGGETRRPTVGDAVLFFVGGWIYYVWERGDEGVFYFVPRVKRCLWCFDIIAGCGIRFGPFISEFPGSIHTSIPCQSAHRRRRTLLRPRPGQPRPSRPEPHPANQRRKDFPTIPRLLQPSAGSGSIRAGVTELTAEPPTQGRSTRAQRSINFQLQRLWVQT